MDCPTPYIVVWFRYPGEDWQKIKVPSPPAPQISCREGKCGKPGTWHFSGHPNPPPDHPCGKIGYWLWTGYYTPYPPPDGYRWVDYRVWGYERDNPYYTNSSPYPLYSSCDGRQIMSSFGTYPMITEGWRFEADPPRPPSGGWTNYPVNGFEEDDPKLIVSEGFEHLISSCDGRTMFARWYPSPPGSTTTNQYFEVNSAAGTSAERTFVVKTDEIEIYKETRGICPEWKLKCEDECPPNTCECRHGNRVCCYNSQGYVVKSFLI